MMQFVRHDYITMGTRKPPVRRPQEELEFGDGTSRNHGTTYADNYPKILAYERRQAIPNRGSHWITKPKNMVTENTTSYDRKSSKKSDRNLFTLATFD